MKYILQFLLCTSIIACNGNKNNKEITASSKDNPQSVQNYFPVTPFIKGQLYDFKARGISPLKYTTIHGKTDSVWLKQEEVEGALSEFLQPSIDSVNMIPLFSEKKFLDQTIAAYTYTYEPKIALPDSISISRWDVLIDQESSKVRRIYLVKELPDHKILQLIWQADKWCKIISIINSQVEKEIKISWEY